MPPTSGRKTAEDPRSRARGRRRIAFIVGFVVLVPLGLFVNVGSYQDYVEAKERYGEKAEEIALLERENAAYESEIDRLGRDSYLEAMARRELTFAQPGEEVFIVKNLPEESPESAEEAGEEPAGPLEQLIDSLTELL